MDSTMSVDVAMVDVDFLQFLELAAELGKFNPYKGYIEEIFSQWLSLPETEQLVMSLVEDAKAGIPLNTPNSSCTASLSVSTPSMFPAGTMPPLSPRTGSSSFFSPRSSIIRTGAGSGSLISALKRVSEPVNEIIPQFYFPNGPTPPKETVDEFLKEIDFYFVSHSDGLHFSKFVHLTKEVCKLPSFFSSSLFKKIDMENSGRVTRKLNMSQHPILTTVEYHAYNERIADAKSLLKYACPCNACCGGRMRKRRVIVLDKFCKYVKAIFTTCVILYRRSISATFWLDSYVPGPADMLVLDIAWPTLLEDEFGTPFAHPFLLYKLKFSFP